VRDRPPGATSTTPGQKAALIKGVIVGFAVVLAAALCGNAAKLKWLETV
jgi:hypothetical protein